MKTRFIWLSRSVSASLLTGLLFCLACLNSHAQVFLGASDSTGFRGQATAVSGFALGSSLTFVNSGALFVSGGAEEASSLGESVTGVFTTGVTHTSAIGQGTM